MDASLFAEKAGVEIVQGHNLFVYRGQIGQIGDDFFPVLSGGKEGIAFCRLHEQSEKERWKRVDTQAELVDALSVG
jgi:hypothetical protein